MEDKIFGPVASIISSDDFEESLRLANAAGYGLQAAVFTKDIDRVPHTAHRPDFGGVIINDMPTFRADHMPYGGNKRSGLGREGVRFAIEDMTNIQMVAIRTNSPDKWRPPTPWPPGDCRNYAVVTADLVRSVPSSVVTKPMLLAGSGPGPKTREANEKCRRVRPFVGVRGGALLALPSAGASPCELRAGWRRVPWKAPAASACGRDSLSHGADVINRSTGCDLERRIRRRDVSRVAAVGLVDAYMEYARGNYVDLEGRRSAGLEPVEAAAALLKGVYGDAPTAEFGPVALRHDRPGSVPQRDQPTRRVIKRIFRWAVADERVSPTVYQALACVEPLRRGRSGARETPAGPPGPPTLTPTPSCRTCRRAWRRWSNCSA